ncbi:MAG: Na+/H+ antiporter subunit E [Pseudonocardia sp.]|nr:Na+/H+ antiporter subunit E [Pseudonocardia sp.]
MTRVLSVLWLAFVWVLLWGSFTLLTVVGGVLVGFVVTAIWRPGPVQHRLPVRPLALLSLAAFLARDLVVSSGQVSWQTLRYGARSRGAVLELPLLSRSDRVVALMSGAYTLSPGTMVLQIDLRGSRWYIYVLGPRDAAGVEAARRDALGVQRRVLAAFGTPEECAAARELERA